MKAPISDLVAITITLDPSPIERTLYDLGSLLSEVAERSPELLHSLVDFIEPGSHLFVIERDLRAAAGADEFRLRANPSQGLTVLMSALRTGNVDLAVIKQAFGHGSSSVAEKANSTASEGNSP